MKTIEQKALAYDEAIRKAKDMLSYKEVRQEDIEYLFPELRESENERIRKELIITIKSSYACGITTKEKRDKFIAWLEKQGEKPQGKSALEAWKEKKVDNRNKVESAWNNGYCNGYIQAIDKACEWLENHNDYIDVKDGNVTYFDMEKCVKDFKKHMKGNGND